MTNKFSRPGDVITWTNGTGSAVSSNDVVDVEGYGAGVASVDIASAATGSVAICGVFTLTRNSSDTFVEGHKVWWDPSAEEVINIPVSGSLFLGYSEETLSAAAGNIDVRLAPYAEEGTRYLSVAAATTLAKADFYSGSLTLQVDTQAAGRTITLPPVADVNINAKMLVERTGTGTNAITLDGNDSENVGGGATYTALDAQGDFATFISDGTEWQLTAPKVIA